MEIGDQMWEEGMNKMTIVFPTVDPSGPSGSSCKTYPLNMQELNRLRGACH